MMWQQFAQPAVSSFAVPTQASHLGAVVPNSLTTAGAVPLGAQRLTEPAPPPKETTCPEPCATCGVVGARYSKRQSLVEPSKRRCLDCMKSHLPLPGQQAGPPVKAIKHNPNKPYQLQDACSACGRANMNFSAGQVQVAPEYRRCIECCAVHGPQVPVLEPGVMQQFQQPIANQIQQQAQQAIMQQAMVQQALQQQTIQQLMQQQLQQPMQQPMHHSVPLPMQHVVEQQIQQPMQPMQAMQPVLASIQTAPVGSLEYLNDMHKQFGVGAAGSDSEPRLAASVPTGSGISFNMPVVPHDLRGVPSDPPKPHLAPEPCSKCGRSGVLFSKRQIQKEPHRRKCLDCMPGHREQTQEAITKAAIESQIGPLGMPLHVQAPLELVPSKTTEASVAKLSTSPTPCLFCGRSGPHVLYSKRQMALKAEERRCQECMDDLKLKRKAEDMQRENLFATASQPETIGTTLDQLAAAQLLGGAASGPASVTAASSMAMAETAEVEASPAKVMKIGS